MKNINQYKCKHCLIIVERESTKQWIKSYCSLEGRNTHLMLLKQQINENRTIYNYE